MTETSSPTLRCGGGTGTKGDRGEEVVQGGPEDTSILTTYVSK